MRHKLAFHTFNRFYRKFKEKSVLFCKFVEDKINRVWKEENSFV